MGSTYEMVGNSVQITGVGKSGGGAQGPNYVAYVLVLLGSIFTCLLYNSTL